MPAEAWFTTELSVPRTPHVDTDPEAPIWSHEIATVAKSERGLEETRQGTSLTVRWPVAGGAATLRLDPYAVLGWAQLNLDTPPATSIKMPGWEAGVGVKYGLKQSRGDEEPLVLHRGAQRLAR